MLALFRNPLLLLLVRLWWLPALTLLAAWGLGGERGWRWASNGIVAYLAAVAAMICAAWARGAFAAMRERARLRSAQHRFLCPQCLHFGGFHFACGACSKSVEDFLVHTGGDYVNDCRHCKAELLAHVQARCEHCQHTCDRAVYHQRQVHVLAALLPDDFTALRQILSTEEKQAQGNLAYTCKDDGTRLTYLVNLKSLPGKYDKKLALPRKHAVWELNSIWLDATGDDKAVAFEIGKAADPPISLTKTLTICVP